MKEIHAYLLHAAGESALMAYAIRMQSTPLIIVSALGVGLSLGFALVLKRFGRSL